jgi:hypothetical protein
MHSWSRFDNAGDPPYAVTGLPALLAEYGRIAAQLPDADAVESARLHQRLRELDEVIDRQVAALGLTRL